MAGFYSGLALLKKLSSPTEMDCYSREDIELVVAFMLINYENILENEGVRPSSDENLIITSPNVGCQGGGSVWEISSCH